MQMARPQCVCVCDTPLALVVVAVVVLVVIVVVYPKTSFHCFHSLWPLLSFSSSCSVFQKLSWGVCVYFWQLIFIHCCFVVLSVCLKVVVFKLGVDELVAQHFLLHLSLRFLIADQWRSWAWSAEPEAACTELGLFVCLFFFFFFLG